MRKTAVLTALALLSMVLAGCSEEAAPPEEDDGPKLEVTEDTGGIRGVVVDQNIMPVADATVRINQLDLETLTDEEGLFTFSGLEPATYFIDVTKPLHSNAQASTDVVAGVAEPKILNIQITKLIEGSPYVETYQFEGFYECAFAGVWITDSCDMAARTAHDAGVEPVPRQIQDNRNTQFIPWTDSILSVVQEGFWKESATDQMWFMLSSTPIDNECDCSATDYLSVISSESPTYGRLDQLDEGAWPAIDQDAAARGFIPWFEPDDPGVAYAIDLKFDIFTTIFHHYIPDEGWNIQDKDDYPVPS